MKEFYSTVKAGNKSTLPPTVSSSTLSHGEVMKELSKMYAMERSIKNQDKENGTPVTADDDNSNKRDAGAGGDGVARILFDAT